MTARAKPQRSNMANPRTQRPAPSNTGPLPRTDLILAGIGEIGTGSGGRNRSPDGAKRNPGWADPDFAPAPRTLHPGYGIHPGFRARCAGAPAELRTIPVPR